jgi:hypothetical protein
MSDIIGFTPSNEPNGNECRNDTCGPEGPFSICPHEAYIRQQVYGTTAEDMYDSSFKYVGPHQLSLPFPLQFIEGPSSGIAEVTGTKKPPEVFWYGRKPRSKATGYILCCAATDGGYYPYWYSGEYYNIHSIEKEGASAGGPLIGAIGFSEEDTHLSFKGFKLASLLKLEQFKLGLRLLRGVRNDLVNYFRAKIKEVEERESH